MRSEPCKPYGRRPSEWNVDKEQTGAFGGSAGAQLCMWLAYHDDMADPSSSDPIARESTRLTFVAPLSGQTTNDFDWWVKNLPGYHELHREPSEIFGTNDRDKWLPIAKKISAVSTISADDPPTYMHYGMAPDDPIPAERAEAWQVHHINFGIALKKRMDALGVESYLAYPGSDSKYASEADFFIRKFGNFR